MKDAPKTEGAIFLDRDGVLNKRLPGRYVQYWSEWEWLPGVLTAIARLAQKFDRIIIVTNQQGIGKGLMSEEELSQIHHHALKDIIAAGGRIDAFYHCPHLKNANCVCRKPRRGMIDQALQDFPLIDLSQSSLLGDSLSDLQLGAKLGVQNIWIDTKEEDRASIKQALKEEGDFYVNERYTALREYVSANFPN